MVSKLVSKNRLVSELTIEGNRLAPRVLIPCMPELLVGNDDSKSENVEIEFKIVPIFINIGINEKQSLTDAMAKDNKKSIIGIGSKKYMLMITLLFSYYIIITSSLRNEYNDSCEKIFLSRRKTK